MTAVRCEAGCGRLTTDPFVWSGKNYCPICMEQINKSIVDSREIAYYKRYRPQRNFAYRQRRFDRDD